MTEPTADPAAEKFPPVFWAANVTELFERAAYYSMASFVVIYLGQLGFGNYWPSNLNSLLWAIVYFLPILSGTIADVVGFRRSLLVAFVLLSAGYAIMGLPVWAGWATVATTIGSEVTASPALMATMVFGIVVIGLGGSVVKPCISGTIQKSSGLRATLGFAIFYMVINIGSLFGRGTAFVVRSGSPLPVILGVVAVCALAAAGLVLIVYRTTRAGGERASVWPSTLAFTAVVVASGAVIAWVYGLGAEARAAVGPGALSYIFAVAAVASVAAFFSVLLFYREPEVVAPASARPRRSMGRILLDMVLVLRHPRFTLFLLVISGFFFLYAQVYNVLPLYCKRVVETGPAMDLYTAANPFVIVCFQLLVSRLFGKMRPVRSMIVGTVIIAGAMCVNLAPVYAAGGVRALVANWLPIGSVFVVLTVGLVAFGELFTSARMYEYIGALAPKGQEGLYLGYANLPMALGVLAGGPVGAFIFNEVMARGATVRPDGLLELNPTQNTLGWLILVAVGLVTAVALWVFNRWLERNPAPAPTA